MCSRRTEEYHNVNKIHMISREYRMTSKILKIYITTEISQLKETFHSTNAPGKDFEKEYPRTENTNLKGEVKESRLKQSYKRVM